METDILELLLQYSSNHKLCDEAFFQKTLSTAIKELSLEDFVNTYHICDEVSYNEENHYFSLAIYQYLSKNINIFLGSIEKKNEELLKQYPYLDETELYLIKNVSILKAIFHELEHAHQMKKLQLFLDDLETFLLKVSFRYIRFLQYPEIVERLKKEGFKEIEIYDSLLQSKRKDEALYDLNPAERIADIASINTVFQITKPIHYLYPTLSDFLNHESFNMLSKGYTLQKNIVLSPSIIYIEKSEYKNQLKEQPFYHKNNDIMLENVCSNYSLSQRLLYGLPITVEEYQKIK